MQDSSPPSVVTLPKSFVELSTVLGPYGCYLYLFLYNLCEADTRWVELSLRELAEVCGVSVPTIRPIIPKLISVKLIEREKSVNPNEPTRYRLILPKEVKPIPKPEPLFSMEPTPGPKADPLEGFEEWWGHYPKKHSKGDARKRWAQLVKDKELPPLEVLIAAADNYAAYVAQEKLDHSTTLNPATYLNREGWLNEYQVKRRASQRTGAYDDL